MDWPTFGASAMGKGKRENITIMRRQIDEDEADLSKLGYFQWHDSSKGSIWRRR
jgi:hypothetical protein